MEMSGRRAARLNIWEDCHTLTTLHETIATKTRRGKKGEEKNETEKKTEEKSRRSMGYFFPFIKEN